MDRIEIIETLIKIADELVMGSQIETEVSKRLWYLIDELQDYYNFD